MEKIITSKNLESEIIRITMAHSNLNFYELDSLLWLEGCYVSKGAFELCYENNVIWPGINLDLALTVKRLLEEGKIKIKGCEPYFYLIRKPLPNIDNFKTVTLHFTGGVAMTKDKGSS